MSTVGERVKSVRQDRGVTQAKLAKAIGARQSTINDIEKGRTKKTTFLVSIAGFLDVDVQWLSSGIGDIRGGEVEILSQGAPLPLFTMDSVVDIGIDDSFDKPVVSVVYRCPVSHSQNSFTVVLENDRDDLKRGSLMFVDPAGGYKNGDIVLTVFPDSKMADITMIISDGAKTYLKSLEPSLPNEHRLTEFNLSCMNDNELSLPHQAKAESPRAILVGRVIFVGVSLN